MPMGNMYEVALTVEGYQSSGYADVYRNQLNISGGGGGGNNGGNPGYGDVTRIQAESMSISGPYARPNNSPFDGVALYSNGETVKYTKYFENNNHSFSLRCASDNNSIASVD